jgi:hypothetical protein
MNIYSGVPFFGLAILGAGLFNRSISFTFFVLPQKRVTKKVKPVMKTARCCQAALLGCCA